MFMEKGERWSFFITLPTDIVETLKTMAMIYGFASIGDMVYFYTIGRFKPDKKVPRANASRSARKTVSLGAPVDWICKNKDSARAILKQKARELYDLYSE